MGKEQRKHQLNSTVKANTHNRGQYNPMQQQNMGQHQRMNGMQQQGMGNMRNQQGMQQMPKGMPQGMQGMPQQMQGMPQQGMPQGMPQGMQMPNMMPKGSNGMQMMNGVRNAHSNMPGMQMQQQNKMMSSQSNQMNDDWINKKKSFSQDHFDSLKNTQEKCQYLGEIFWPYVAVREPEMKRKITGFMIWNFDHAELIDAI